MSMMLPLMPFSLTFRPTFLTESINLLVPPPVTPTTEEVTPDTFPRAEVVTSDRAVELARLYTAEAAEENSPRAVAMVGDSSSSSSSSSVEHSPSSYSSLLSFWLA